MPGEGVGVFVFLGFDGVALDDLRALAAAAKAMKDDGMKRAATSVCSKIADRLGSDEARKAVEGL